MDQNVINKYIEKATAAWLEAEKRSLLAQAQLEHNTEIANAALEQMNKALEEAGAENRKLSDSLISLTKECEEIKKSNADFASKVKIHDEEIAELEKVNRAQSLQIAEMLRASEGVKEMPKQLMAPPKAPLKPNG